MAASSYSQSVIFGVLCGIPPPKQQAIVLLSGNAQLVSTIDYASSAAVMRASSFRSMVKLIVVLNSVVEFRLVVSHRGSDEGYLFPRGVSPQSIVDVHDIFTS